MKRRMRCPKCGAEILQGHYYCSNCDYQLTPEEYARSNRRGMPPAARIAAVIAVLLLLGGAFVAGTRLFAQQKPDGDADGQSIVDGYEEPPDQQPTAESILISDVSQSPLPTPTQMPTPTPAPTPERTPISDILNDESRTSFIPFPVRYGLLRSMPQSVTREEQMHQILRDMYERGERRRTIRNISLSEAALNQVIVDCPAIDYCSYTLLGSEATLEVNWRPGVSIWQAAVFSREASLSVRDRRILDQARVALAQIILPGMTDLAKARAIHDYICQHCAYLIDDAKLTTYCYGFFENGVAQCSGYTDTFLLLCRLSDIWVCTVNGETTDGDPAYDSSHSWNLIYLDGLWYMVDVTWDDNTDGTFSHSYFNVPQSYLALTRSWKSNILPEGTYAQRLDEKWGCWDLPYVTSVDEAVDLVKDALHHASEITLRLADGLLSSDISQRVANSMAPSTTIWCTDLLEKNWAHIARFDTHG